jgi:hypothetical protein
VSTRGRRWTVAHGKQTCLIDLNWARWAFFLVLPSGNTNLLERGLFLTWQMKYQLGKTANIPSDLFKAVGDALMSSRALVRTSDCEKFGICNQDGLTSKINSFRIADLSFFP